MDGSRLSASTESGDKNSRPRNDESYSSERKERSHLKRVGDYVLGDVLGEGSYGQVREGLYVPPDLEASKEASLIGQAPSDKLKYFQRVAVKIIRRRLLTRKVRNGQENLKREIACLKRLKHQNVIQLYDTIDDPSMDKIYLVFELANFLSLQDILDLTQKNGNASFKAAAPFEKLKNLQNLFYQLTVGLVHCHSRGVVHRDIKPSNLQLTLDGVLKIIDFGVAELLERYSELDDTEKFAGTPAFQPPEVARGSRSFSATKVDVWAAGVTLFVMATGEMPFRGETTDELYANISTGDYEIPQELPSLLDVKDERERTDEDEYGNDDGEDLRDLISSVMNPNPDDRATLEAVLKHPWLAGQDRVPALELPQSIKESGSKKESLLQRYMELDSDGEDQPDDDGLGEEAADGRGAEGGGPEEEPEDDVNGKTRDQLLNNNQSRNLHRKTSSLSSTNDMGCAVQ